MCARACVAALRTAPLRRAYIHFIHFISFHFISCSHSFVSLSPHSTARGSTERYESHSTCGAVCQNTCALHACSSCPLLLCLAPCWRSRFGVVVVSALRVPLAPHACLSSVSYADWTGLARRARLEGAAERALTPRVST